MQFHADGVGFCIPSAYSSAILSCLEGKLGGCCMPLRSGWTRIPTFAYCFKNRRYSSKTLKSMSPEATDTSAVLPLIR